MPCPPPGDLPDPGIQPRSLASAGVFFTISTPWGAPLAQFSSVQPLSHVRLFATPWTVVCQASLLITNSQSLLKLMSIESVTPSNHLILCHPLLLLPSIFPSIRVFSNESAHFFKLRYKGHKLSLDNIHCHTVTIVMVL